MNAVEHIVEVYFRICRDCFTMSDVKVQGGNNRQFDLLAVDMKGGNHYHVESCVTHSRKFQPSKDVIKGYFDRKFLGAPRKNDGKDYRQQIQETYKGVGLQPEPMQRIWVQWTTSYLKDWERFLDEYYRDTGVRVQSWPLKDKIIPELQEKIATGNYDDEILRTFSLLKSYSLPE